MTFQNEHMVKMDQWEDIQSPISQWDVRICNISNWPLDPWHWTDGLWGWWRGVADKKRKSGKNGYIISSAANNCLTNANNCNDCWAGEGLGHGEEARTVTWECDAWHECDMWWAAEWIMSLSSHRQLDNSWCEKLRMSKHCDNCAEEITVSTVRLLSHSSHHRIFMSQVRWRAHQQ